VGAGSGLYLCAIAAYEAGLYVVPLGATQGGTIAPPTAGALGTFTSPSVVLAIVGLVITAVLLQQRVRGAILIGIIVTTVLGMIAQAVLNVPFASLPGKLQLSGSPISAPDFQYVGIGVPGLSFLTRAGGAALLTGLLATLSLLLSDFFDTAGTFTAVGAEAGLVDAEGRLREN